MNNHEATDKQQYLIKRISLSLGLLAILALVFRLYLAPIHPPVVYIAISMLAIYSLVYFLASNNHFLDLCAWLISLNNLVGLFCIFYFVGGLNSSLAIVIPQASVLAFFIIKGKSTWGISIITMLGALFFLYLHQIDYPFPQNQLTESGKQMMTVVWLIITVLIMSMVMQNIRQQNIMLENRFYENSMTDHLTGLHNRRYFDQFIEQEIARAKREQSSLSMILIDIDYFKLFNDTYGHQAGDNCIKKISESLQQYFRRSIDIIIRYGGEEFLVMLPNTERQKAYDLAEGFRLEIELLNIQHELSEHKIVTVSLGVNTADGDDQVELEQLIGGADRAMYVSKNKGRNKTAQAESHSSST